MEDDSGPTLQRIQRSQNFYEQTGRAKSSRRYTMLDDQLGRLLMRRAIGQQEYSALRRYALHWLAAGLQGYLGSVDLNRVLCFDASQMSGLAKTERQAEHRRIYHAARERIGYRPAMVADQIACYDSTPADVGCMLGYHSIYRGRSKALEILGDAGYRLDQYWTELAKRR